MSQLSIVMLIMHKQTIPTMAIVSHILILTGALCGVASAFVAPTAPQQISPRLFSTLQKDDVVEVESVTNPRKEGLALMLDDGTRKSHSMAENTAFVSGFFKGIATKESFANLGTL